MDLASQYGDFLNYQEARGCSPRTRRAYQHDFNRLAVFLSESGFPITLASLTAPVMRRYIVWLRQGHAPWTIRRRIGSLRAFLGYCVDEELLDRNPMARVPTPKAPAPLPRYLTFEEVRQVLDAVDHSKSKFRLRDQALVRVLLYCGVRLSIDGAVAPSPGSQATGGVIVGTSRSSSETVTSSRPGSPRIARPPPLPCEVLVLVSREHQPVVPEHGC